MTTGARPDGMGQAFSAVADDINTLSFNPAGLGNIRSPEIGYGYESFVGGIQYDFVGAAAPLGGAGVLGLGYIDMGTAPFNSTANPSTPPVSAEDRAFIAGWGRSFYDLHVGVTGKYVLRQLDTVQGSGWGVDFGVRYRPAPYLTFAASLMNLGPGIQMASVEPLPTLVNTGVAWTAIEQPFHTLTLAANAALNIATNTQQFGLGAEYWYQDRFALRAGYVLESLDLGGPFNPDGFSAGAGVRVSFLELDYAFQPLNTLGMVHRLSGMLRWDGPWVSNTEPNPPRYVNIRVTERRMEIRWEKALGPAMGYEVMIQPLNGGEMAVSPPVANPIYYYLDFQPGTLYKVSVRTVGPGGAKSFPSNAAYAVAPGPAVAPNPPPAQEKKVSIIKGVRGAVDTVGLRLSWDEPAGGAAGYNIYRKSPGGQVEKVTAEPQHDNRVWLTDVTGLQGWEWIVTAVGNGGGERTVGSFLWYPSKDELDTLLERPVLQLNASPQANRLLYLDWERDPKASGYALLVSRQDDGVFEFLRDLSPAPHVLLKVGGHQRRFHFILVPKDGKGHWLPKFKGAVAEFPPGV